MASELHRHPTKNPVPYLRLVPRTPPSDQASTAFDVYKSCLATFRETPTTPNAHDALDAFKDFQIAFGVGPRRVVRNVRSLADRLNQAMDRAKRAKQVDVPKSRRVGAIAAVEFAQTPRQPGAAQEERR